MSSFEAGNEFCQVVVNVVIYQGSDLLRRREDAGTMMHVAIIIEY